MLAAAVLPIAAAAEWDQWRGPSRDGRVSGFQVPDRWPPRLVRRWTVPVGEGHSSPIIAGGAAYVHTREGEHEAIRRIELATGRATWRRTYAAPYEMDPAARAHGKGPKATPAHSDGLLYTLGISGILSCSEARTGRVAWRYDPSRDYRRSSPLYGAAASPLVDRGLVIAAVGGHDAGALAAFDARTGRVRWRWTGDGPAYASPLIMDIGGVRQVVTQTQQYCVGVSAASGALLWRIPFKTPYDQNSVTPVVSGDVVVFGGTRQPTAAYRIRKMGTDWSPERLWQTSEVTLYMSTPVRAGGRLYGLSERRGGQLFALDWATGRTEWTGDARLAENASVLAAGRFLAVTTTGGDLHILRTDGAAPKPVVQYRAAVSPVWATPAVAGRRVLVKDEKSLTAWELPPLRVSPPRSSGLGGAAGGASPPRPARRLSVRGGSG